MECENWALNIFTAFAMPNFKVALVFMRLCYGESLSYFSILTEESFKVSPKRGKNVHICRFVKNPE